MVRQPTVKIRAGIVGAYVGTGDVAIVREARRIAGRVTVNGKSGLRVLATLAKDDDLYGVDLDPAGYLARDSAQLELFPRDWIGPQREWNLPVIRSDGRYVRSGDRDALKIAMNEPLKADVTRVVSLHERWLRGQDLGMLINAVGACDNPLSFVFASVMDPFAAVGALQGLLELGEAAGADGRRVELLRTDLTGIGFSARGGSFAAIGLSTAARHHGLPIPSRQQEPYIDRQRWPLVFVPSLACWQRGYSLGALAEYGGAGITDCPCAPCGGRSLLRFDQSSPNRVPVEVRTDAQAHDLASWSRLAGDVLTAPEPWRAWADVCAGALATAAMNADQYKVALELPRSLDAWARLGS
jgi:hypothetical protein